MYPNQHSEPQTCDRGNGHTGGGPGRNDPCQGISSAYALNIPVVFTQMLNLCCGAAMEELNVHEEVVAQSGSVEEDCNAFESAREHVADRMNALDNKVEAAREHVADRMAVLDNNVASFIKREQAERARADEVIQRRIGNLERKFESRLKDISAVLHGQRE